MKKAINTSPFVLLVFLLCFQHNNFATDLVVHAKGSQLQGEYAHFRVMLGNQEIGDSYTTGTYNNYCFPIESGASLEEVSIVFDNDKKSGGQDRNLYVKNISIYGVEYDAESNDVIYVRKNGDEITYSGVMPWNGKLVFYIHSTPVVCEGDIWLTSQAQVDAFDCNVTGSLTISGKDIINLDGLTSLNRISGNLRIVDNPNLQNIRGLSSLTEVSSSVLISGNHSLVSLDGLNQIEEIDDGSLTIRDNPVLKNLDGLSSLKAVYGLFFITNNDALTDLSGLSSLRTIAYGSAASFYIDENDALENIDGISMISHISEGLFILNNKVLKTVPKFQYLESWYVYIEDNPELERIGGFKDEFINPSFEISIKNNPSLENCCTLFSLLHAASQQTSPWIEVSDNGAFCTKEEILANGPCDNLIVKAKGTKAGDEYAHFTVLVNGEDHGDAYTSANYYSHIFSFSPASVEEVTIVFDNDKVIEGDDRNLYILEIELNGQVFDATPENVTYIRKDGKIIDYKGTMWWNGSLVFDFSTSNARLAANTIKTTEGNSSFISLLGEALVYPNPSSGQFTLQLDNFENGPVDIVLYDLTGKALFYQKAVVSNQHLYHEVDMYYPKKGIYLLTIAGRENSIDKKLVIN